MEGEIILLLNSIGYAILLGWWSFGIAPGNLLTSVEWDLASGSVRTAEIRTIISSTVVFYLRVCQSCDISSVRGEQMKEDCLGGDIVHSEARVARGPGDRLMGGSEPIELRGGTDAEIGYALPSVHSFQCHCSWSRMWYVPTTPLNDRNCKELPFRCLLESRRDISLQ